MKVGNKVKEGRMSEDLTMKGLRAAAKAGDGYAKIVLAKLESKEAENDNQNDNTSTH